MKTLVCEFIGEPTTSQQAEAARAAAGRAALLQFGGGKERRIGEYKARHVETEPVGESIHVALCMSPRRVEAGQRERRRRYRERKTDVLPTKKQKSCPA